MKHPPSVCCILFLFLLSGIVFLPGCGKDGVSRADVSAQWQIDENGGIIKSLNDGQWQQKTFTKQELELFSSLDTMSLAGTTAPATINNQRTYAYPNPFVGAHDFPLKCESGYNGSCIFKYVIVDNKMKSVDRAVARLYFSNGIASVRVGPEITSGKYRVYYTLSASGKPHFFQTWGNVEKR